MANWWEDENFSNNLLALGSGLLAGSGPSNDPANRSLGAAFGKGGMAMLQQMAQNAQNKRAERAISVQEEQNRIAREKAQAEMEAHQLELGRQRTFAGSLTGAPEETRAQVGPPGNLVSLQDTLPAIQPNPLYANIDPAKLSLYAQMPYKEGAKQLAADMDFGDVKPYIGADGKVDFYQTNKLGLAKNSQGRVTSLSGLKPYEKQEIVDTGVKDDPSMMTKAIRTVDADGKTVLTPVGQPWKRSEGTKIVLPGEKAKNLSDELFIKQFAAAHEAFRGLEGQFSAVQDMESLLKNPHYAGNMAEGKMKFQSFLNSLGLPSDLEKLSKSEELRALFKEKFVSEMGRLGARGLSQQESAELMKSLADVNQSPQAMLAIVNRYKKQINQVAKDYSRMYQGNIKRFGPTSVEGFFEPRQFGSMDKF